MERPSLIELAVVAGTAALLAACVILMARLAAGPGDVLAFFGGLIGAGAAVSGALWVGRHQTHRRAAAERRRLGQALVAVGATATGVGRAADHDLAPSLRSLEAAMMTLVALRGTTWVDDVPDASFATLAWWLPRHLADIDRVAAALEAGASPADVRPRAAWLAEAALNSARGALSSGAFGADERTALERAVAAQERDGARTG